MMIDIERLVPVFRALGDASRLRILVELLDEPRHVGALVRRSGLRQSLVSHHLKVLREAGLVAARRRGPFVYYELSGNAVRAMLASAAGDAGSHGHENNGGAG
ncbi:MAG: winged helix-turn-helix transcriptional regulator [Acidobacteria bacterium]|nr:winged helix-turn-helix transcriptional regulator [Acidobacteriota bacterium]